MKSFETFKELLDNIGAKFTFQKTYAENELTSFLENEGSYSINDDIENAPTFNILVDDIDYEITVTYEYNNNDEIIYKYWLMD